jgi:hypothetical protein
MNDRLFIANKEQDIGYIVEAEIRRSKANNGKYIWVTLAFSGVDEKITGVLGRLAYTSYVVRYDLDESEEAEAANVASMIGRSARVKWEHKHHIDRTFIGYTVVAVN